MPQNVHHYWDHYYSPGVGGTIYCNTHTSESFKYSCLKELRTKLASKCVCACVCLYASTSAESTLVLFLGFD